MARVIFAKKVGHISGETLSSSPIRHTIPIRHNNSTKLHPKLKSGSFTCVPPSLSAFARIFVASPNWTFSAGCALVREKRGTRRAHRPERGQAPHLSRGRGMVNRTRDGPNNHTGIRITFWPLTERPVGLHIHVQTLPISPPRVVYCSQKRGVLR